MRLIDADALGIGKANPLVFDRPEYAHGWNCAVGIIQDAPTIDAVPVVRCKDCKEYYKGKCDSVLGLPNPYPESFCSFGERRSE